MSGQMHRRRGNAPDLWTGLLLCAIALVFLWAGRTLAFGTAARIGPGLFPAVVAGLLLVLGLCQIMLALRAGRQALPPWGARGLAAVMAGLGAFALLMSLGQGLVLAGAAVLVLAGLGQGRFRPVEVALLVLVVITASVLVFHVALGLPMRIWPEWF
ncbi:MAG: tripartite tricarboxylate transporter TctB family protein [Paracoccus sp. (in: a-proteobacteria)]|uniref:tripartite tricarboxylate transporter TctB family protein n=1 Tax=Paracoccus sp. TaxID=267 RepID=UPI0039E49C24